jgi:hypothetical protein
MPSERLRILELALESLEYKKKQIDEEIAALTAELKHGGAKSVSPAAPAAAPAPLTRKRSRFSRAERARRSVRMTAYWAERRKEKTARKK